MKWYYIRLQNGNYQTNKDIIKQVNHAISISLKYNKDDDSNDNGVFFNVNEQTCQSIFASSDASFNVYFNRKPLDIDNIQINNNFKVS